MLYEVITIQLRTPGLGLLAKDDSKHVGGQGLELPFDHLTLRAVQREPVAFPQRGIADAGFARAIIHAQRVAADNAYRITSYNVCYTKLLR